MTAPKIRILFEDSEILAVDKPSGIPGHSLSDPNQVTVESILKKTRDSTDNLQILHRLDTGTSGVLLFAKSAEVFQEMRSLFQERKIQKFYRAWSRPHSKLQPNAPERSFASLPFVITTPLAHHPKSAKRMVALMEGKKISYRGKAYPAETRILSESVTAEGMHEFEVQIITGVTHQIRVHLASVGFPLVGDLIYNPTARDAPPERLGLHAERVEFDFHGKHYLIESPLCKPAQNHF